MTKNNARAEPTHGVEECVASAAAALAVQALERGAQSLPRLR